MSCQREDAAVDLERAGRLTGVTITVVIEDMAAYDSGLLGQHGIALLICCESKGGTKRILFDTGQSAAPLLHNMRELAVDPASVDMVFLSHCHLDHTGGLVGFLEAAGKTRIPIIAHPDLFKQAFVTEPGLRSIGMGPGSQDAVQQAGGEVFLSRQPLPIMPGALSAGEVGDAVPFEGTPTLTSYVLSQGTPARDSLRDEVALVLILEQGLVVVSGCSHPGIVTTMEHAMKVTGVTEILGVVGGLHLVQADSGRIDRTVEAIRDSGARRVCVGHCTGSEAEMRLRQAFGESFVRLQSGTVLEF
ncbi:MAG: MBL fold metallo-hydrolase [bacterium]|nr:MBL fold metallo-hydrolase [bacterium]